MISKLITPGTCYLTKGSSNLLWWMLRDCQPTLHYNPDTKDINQIISDEDLLDDDLKIKVIIAFRSDAKELLQLSRTSVSPTSCVFMVLSEADGTLSKPMEKVYKNVSTDTNPFVQLDLSHWKWQEDSPFPELLSSYEDAVKTKLLQELPNPSRLYWQLTQCKTPEHYSVPSEDEDEINYLLSSLGKSESFRIWDSLPKSSLHALFFSSQLEQCAAYKILAGQGIKGGLCPSLWMYFSIMVERYLIQFETPSYLLKLFVRWVYLSSTLWRTNTHKGFYKTEYRSKSYYNFCPSPVAVQALSDLFNVENVWSF